MAASIEEKVIEKLRVLPEDQQAEILKFVEDLAGLEMKVDHGQAVGRVAIWDKIREIIRDVPDDVLANIPKDGSIIPTKYYGPGSPLNTAGEFHQAVQIQRFYLFRIPHSGGGGRKSLHPHLP